MPRIHTTMIEEIKDMQSLRRHLRESKKNYQEAVVEHYQLLGQKHGFTTVKNPTIIADGLDFGKETLAWIEPDILFIMEFGNKKEIYRHLYNIASVKPAKTILLLSSKSSTKPAEVKDITKKSKLVKDLDITVVDLSKED